ncbi:hypothetical protein ACHWQZ_G016194 [Mnemiopsis leidyi]
MSAYLNQNNGNIEPASGSTSDPASISFSKRSNTDDKIAFKTSITGMMVPQSSPGDNDSLVSVASIGPQVTKKIRRHTQIQTNCQNCGKNIMTTVTHEKTFFTYLCTLLLLPCCCCFVPHIFKKFQRPRHKCPICDQPLEVQIISG